MTTRILGGKGNRTRRSQKASCRATTSRRPPTRYERSHTRKVNLCIIQVESGVDTLKSLCSPAARWGGAPTRHSRAVRPRTSVHGSVVTTRPPPNNRAAERKSAVEKNGGGSLSCLPRCSLLRHNTLLRRRPWPLLRIVDRGLPSTALSDRLLPQRSGPTLQASM